MRFLTMTMDTDMRCEDKGFPTKIIRDGIVILSIFSVLLPGSFLVLCIGPGNHIAIEDFNAACCEISVNPIQQDRYSSGKLDMAGGCRNCKDCLLSLNECSAVSKFNNSAVQESIANESFGDGISASASSRLFRQIASRNAAILPCSGCAVPLRC
jgi:hypothetical protein